MTKLKQPKLNRPDVYKVTDDVGGLLGYFQTDPRVVLPPSVHVCSQRRMTWHGTIIVWDLCHRDGRIWDGYDTNQIRGYSNFEEFRADPVIRPEDYCHYKGSDNAN